MDRAASGSPKMSLILVLVSGTLFMSTLVRSIVASPGLENVKGKAHKGFS